ncbi:hypothetical protein FRB96_002973 [Tulasnella sp. 330]|nr:hypothetical protein FRB96_002973 [Tulasnella sp. 330]KAG8876144.1 hypothetical protein FRB97_004420 [Tulasnella sp. 331]KAG8881719.1 hypothetical protein FRB98_004181 [Tulasnella sp. 332]
MRRSLTTRSVNHSHRTSLSASTPDDLSVSNLRRDSGSNSNSRVSLDSNGTGAPSSSGNFTRRQREPVTGVMDLSTKIEVDEPEEYEDGDRDVNLNMGIGTTVAGELKKELREAQKEIERLASMVTSLQNQLAQRPPLSKVQAVEKEYNQLDLLYHSTQRENQACMAEIEKGKRRERILEGELAKLVGDGWMEHLGLTAQLNVNALTSSSNAQNPSTARPSVAAPRPQTRRPSISRGLSTSSVTIDSTTSVPPVPSMPSSLSSTATPQPVLEHFEQIRSLVLGMDEKMRLNNEKLEVLMAAAKAEEKKYEGLASASHAALLSTAAR